MVTDRMRPAPAADDPAAPGLADPGVQADWSASRPRERSVEPRSLRRWTADRLGELRVHPRRDLGQNFLVDERLLDAVEEAAELEPTDIVLEVGGGLGVLSKRLAHRVAHLHVVEVDPRLCVALDEELRGFAGVTLHRADAVCLDFGRLAPPPGKLVANLPYGVAATVLLKAVEELPQATLFVGMVQREVADRLRAEPGSRGYGATSVLAQLACEVRLHRAVPRAAFDPAPNVDSAIVVLRRCERPPAERVRAFVRDAFAHRRKTLAGSLALARGGDTSVRDRARAALLELGQPADARAERLSPPELEKLTLAVEGGEHARLAAEGS
jgi:16S rRNA (adenine1518-N6/adenine1519-N6)-dimethyltransferase